MSQNTIPVFEVMEWKRNKTLKRLEGQHEWLGAFSVEISDSSGPSVQTTPQIRAEDKKPLASSYGIEDVTSSDAVPNPI